MKTVIAVICAASLLAVGPNALAAEEKKPTPQQEKMKACNKEAGDKQLKGDERKKFMSGCLKGEAAPGAKAEATTGGDSGCEAKALSKDGKPLAGAAKAAFIKKCEADSVAAKK